MSNKVALVTGASRGIGRCGALALAERGYDVAVTGRTVHEGEGSIAGIPLPGSLDKTCAEIEAAGRRALGVAMDVTKLEVARSAMLDTASAHPEVLESPAATVWFTGFGESSFDLELVFWVRDGTLRHTVISDLNFALAEKFRAFGIELPYPSRTVYFRGGQSQGPPAPPSAVG